MELSSLSLLQLLLRVGLAHDAHLRKESLIKQTQLFQYVLTYRKAGKYDGDVKRGLLDIINLIETKI